MQLHPFDGGIVFSGLRRGTDGDIPAHDIDFFGIFIKLYFAFDFHIFSGFKISRQFFVKDRFIHKKLHRRRIGKIGDIEGNNVPAALDFPRLHIEHPSFDENLFPFDFRFGNLDGVACNFLANQDAIGHGFAHFKKGLGRFLFFGFGLFQMQFLENFGLFFFQFFAKEGFFFGAGSLVFKHHLYRKTQLFFQLFFDHLVHMAPGQQKGRIVFHFHNQLVVFQMELGLLQDDATGIAFLLDPQGNVFPFRLHRLGRCIGRTIIPKPDQYVLQRQLGEDLLFQLLQLFFLDDMGKLQPKFQHPLPPVQHKAGQPPIAKLLQHIRREGQFLKLFPKCYIHRYHLTAFRFLPSAHPPILFLALCAKFRLF